MDIFDLRKLQIMKTLFALGIAFIFSETINAQEIDRKSNHEKYAKQPRLYCGMTYDQDTTKKMPLHSDSTKQIKRGEIRIKQSKKDLPSKTANPEPFRRID